MKAIPTICLIIGAITISFAQNKGEQIVEAYDEAYTGWENYTSTSVMTLTNQHGQESQRKLKGKNLEQLEDGDKSMIIFQTPNDVKGTAVLTFTHKEGPDDQWLYLPSIKRVKRIASNNKSGPFVGSEFAYEDLSSQEIEKYTYDYVKSDEFNGNSCEVVLRDPVDPKSGYKYMHVWYNPSKNYRIEKIVFYDRKGSKFKTLLYKKYGLFKEKYYYPGILEMTNHQSSKKTTIEFTNYTFDAGLTDTDFNQARLKNAR